MTRPRTGTVLALAVFAALAGGASAVEPKPAAKPPYQGLLEGQDAEKAAEMAKSIQEREERGQYAEAVRAAEELLALRQRLQGADHWQTRHQKWGTEALRRVAALTPEQQAAWRQAVRRREEAQQLEA